MVLVAVVGLALAAPSARAQNALGNGRALDANLSASGDKTNPSRGRQLEEQIRFNNRLITGQVGGGKSFRGYVGYEGTDEFGGSRGTDNSYTFRRDASSGALVSSGIRAGDALKYQFSLSGAPGTSGALANQATGLFVTSRSDVSSGEGLAAMRSTAGYQSLSGRLPVVMGYVDAGELGRRVVTASSLRGISSTALLPAQPGNALGVPGATAPAGTLTGLERSLRGVPDVRDATAAALRKQQEDARAKAASSPDASARLDTRVEPAQVEYQRIMERLDLRADQPRRPAEPAPKSGEPPANPANPAGAGPEGAPREGEAAGTKVSPWGEDLKKLRARLLEDERRLRTGERRQGAQRPGAASADQKGSKGAPSEPDPREPQVKPVDSKKPTTGEALLDALKKLDARVDRFVPLQEAGEAYTKQMQSGQAALAEGRYFDAEGRFALALALQPGDVMAQVGRVHAQLGAGLYLSAASNLRFVLSSHPEMVPVRYAAELLPQGERPAYLGEQLIKELDKNEATALGQDAALLLAYMGYQFDRAEWRTRGFVEMRERLSDEERAGPRGEQARLFESIWSPEGR
jgi:hypothetical protein